MARPGKARRGMARQGKVFMIEIDLMRSFQFEASRLVPHVRLFRRNIINTKTAGGWHAKAGIPGQCDLWAYVKGGHSIEIETKARRGKLSPAQETWRDWCHEWGVPWMQLKEEKGDSSERTIGKWIDQLRCEAKDVIFR